VTKHKRSIWDDLVELGREISERLDEAFNPQKRERQPVRVPVPVRNNPPRQDPYDRR